MDSATVRRGVFLPLQIIIVLYFFGVVFVFMRRRRLHPLRDRPLWATLGTLLGAAIYGWEVCMRWVWDLGHPCFVWPLYAWPACLCMLNCLLIRVWLLWFKSHASAQTLDIRLEDVEFSRRVSRASSIDSIDGTSSARGAQAPWCLRNKHLVSKKFLLGLFLAKSVPEVLLLWANFLFDPASLTERLGADVDKLCSSNDWAFYVFIIGLGYSTTLFLFAATRYGNVADGFFLKRELALIGYVGIIGGPVWLVLVFGLNRTSIDQFPFESLWLAFLTLLLMTVSGLYPIIKTFQMEQRKSRSSQSNSITERRSSLHDEFTDVLEDSALRADFAEHLKLEFSVENLLFWEAIEKYRQNYDESHQTKNLSMSKRICRRFIESGAPLQVNLDFRTRTKITELFKRDVSNGADGAYVVEMSTRDSKRTIFDEAQRRTVSLMQNDSYVRFRAMRAKSG